MTESKGIRGGFRAWVDKTQVPVPAKRLPLTHVTKALLAQDIIQLGRVEPRMCEVFNSPLAYFFYGRPAYRYEAGSSVKIEASCPICFLFDPKLLEQAEKIFPFDTGAFAARMFNHVLDEDFDREHFDLGSDADRPERLISTAYLERMDYVLGDRDKLRSIDEAARPYELEARAYMKLLSSGGRNEPDDRIGSIEVQFEHAVSLEDNLLAVIIPHTFWTDDDRSPWIEGLAGRGTDVVTYAFTPGRPIQHYHTLLEVAVLEYCNNVGLL